MSSGLGAMLITMIADTTIRSADVNSSFNALNNASTFKFATCQIDPALTPDSTFRGLEMITSTDFGILNDTNANWLRLASGLTSASPVALVDLGGNFSHGFWKDSAYSYVDCNQAMRVRTHGGNGNSTPANALRVIDTNAWNISGTSYGFVTAANGIFNQGSVNADVAETLLTRGDIKSGMAVCIVDHDTVAACTHIACRVAKIVSTEPTVLVGGRSYIDADGNDKPLPGHESARPIVIGGVVPVLISSDELPDIRLGDRMTTSGEGGMLRVAHENEYALGDVVKISQDGIVWAWIHY